MRGIILAGGAGTRLHPLTIPVSKQLMPVYDKPMVYYPLSVLMLAGIKEYLVISQSEQLPAFKKLFGDGSSLGLKIEYAIQDDPRGIAEAFVIGEDFIGDDSVALILGDNIFYGTDLSHTVQDARREVEENGGGIVFAYHVSDPERYGVVEFDSATDSDQAPKVLSIEEKPKRPKSNYAVPGIYFYDNDVAKVAHNLTPSDRLEYEITDVNKAYLSAGKLKVAKMNRGTAWLDTGTHKSLSQAQNFVEIIEERQGLKIGCIEEVAYRAGFITRTQLCVIAEPLKKSGYGEYLLKVAEDEQSGVPVYKKEENLKK